jgi:serine O-acetyltransferase
MFDNVRKDIRRYMITDEVKSLRGGLELFLYNYSLWVIISYRFGRWVRRDFRVPVIKTLLKIITKFTHSLTCLITGIQIPFETEVGPGLYIGHTGMLVINGNSVIGSCCTISVGVVIGQGGRGSNKGCPVIGDNVYIGVGAKVLGKIIIGDHAAIGANAVVVRDIPANATAAGVPAKIINYLGSSDFMRGR